MRSVSVKNPPSPSDHEAYREWEADYVRQLCPSLPSHAQHHFRPRGLRLAPRSKTDARVVRLLKSDGWTWDTSGLVWRNDDAFHLSA